MDIKELYSLFKKHPHITTDSRKAKSDSLFFALRGENFNGNTFAHSALEGGCNYAIIDDENYQVPNKTVLVKDSLITLQELANHHRKQFKIPFLGITGSNGKTTTKELIACILASSFNIQFTQGNLNNHIGVPLTLLTVNDDTQIAVIEFGANHIGEIESLCHIAEPDYGLITNIGKAHLEGFGSFEGVIKAKTELYHFINEHSGTLFINSSQQALMDQSASLNCRIVRYGSSKHDACRGEIIEADPLLHVRLFLSGFPTNNYIEIQTQLFGSYNLDNVLAAACVGLHFGVSPEKIKESIELYSPQNQRSQIVKTSQHVLILDFYNANPSSMQAALEDFNRLAAHDKVVVLGDMFELGEHSKHEHAEIARMVARMNFSQIYLIGPEFSAAAPQNDPFYHFPDTASFVAQLKYHPIADGSTILVKGSRGMKLEQVVDFL
jgi:UDP-N-acetylmuramoyl-tripeptide--D-alanyl-D-alanine ligase